jgi:putative DNA primase/helicase
MYKGYFEFKPTAKPHMSGNGEPKFDGADGGLKRRLLFVEWSVKLDEAKHRDFEDVVSEIVAGGSGILNWLIAGALDFLNNGFVIAEDVQARTDATFSDRDPCAQFITAHVRDDPGGEGVTGRAMYEAYEAWCKANGASKMFETKFGLIMKTKLRRDDTGRVRRYLDVALHDVPAMPSDGHGHAQHRDEPPPHPGFADEPVF